jgi:hypothetical protein
MTEDEAKTKWCPFARTLDWSHADQVRDQPVSASVNREIGNYDKTGNETVRISGRHRCIASACMAWRTEPRAGPHLLHKSVRAEWESAGWITDGVENSAGQLTFNRSASGFCGLAGAPQ